MTEQSTMTETQWHILCHQAAEKFEKIHHPELTVYAFLELAPSIQPDSAVDELTDLFESENKRMRLSVSVECLEDVYHEIGDGNELLPHIDITLKGVWHAVYSADIDEAVKQSIKEDMNKDRSMLVILSYSFDNHRNLQHHTEVMFLPELQKHMMTGKHVFNHGDAD